jgi:hypothetical protein
MLAAFASLLVLTGLAASATEAAPVQEFEVRLKDVRADGRFSVVFTANAYDTSGERPPQLTRSVLRLPRGVRLNRAFLRRERLCDVAALRTLLLEQESASRDYRQLLARVVGGRDIGVNAGSPEARLARTCRAAAIGAGTVMLDARDAFADPVPGLFRMFLARPVAKGAVAAFGVLGLADAGDASVRENPVLPDQRPLFRADVLPARGGGYRVVLPEQLVGLVTFSISELRLTVAGATRRERGRRSFWASLGRCPRSGVLPFRMDSRYETGTTSSRTVRVACPRFRR